MKTSESQINLGKALFAAWCEFPVITKTKEGQAGNRKFMYTPFDEVLDAVRPALHKNRLLLTQGTEGHALITRLEHPDSGEWRETSMPVNAEHANMQSYGIELMYRRRYAAIAILGIVTEEDSDGVGDKTKRKGADFTEPAKTKIGASGRDVLRECFETFQPEIQDSLRKTAAHMAKAAIRSPVDALNVFDMAASQLPDEDKNELKNAVWFLLDSTTRSAIKRVEKETA
jgi:hypothetical protein